MRAVHASFAFCWISVLIACVVIKATGFYEDTNRLGGWSVGLCQGVFFGSFAVWSSVFLARLSERAEKT